MGNIVLLDDLTINKIAAGEVIERPASVIKEMVENSIDAGATNIIIEIKNGGISYIRITDNGKGMPKDDLEIAFERHATSKIRTAEDLNLVKSMGFRGEALASIAAIANVELCSKRENDSIGSKIVVEGGKVLKQDDCACPNGTTITVRNLFFNTPVRYKFLKKDYTESGYIEDVVSRLALVNSNIAFKLINTGKTVIQTNGDGNINNVIFNIYGKDTAKAVFPVEYEFEGTKIYGVIGRPEIARSNRGNQIFFVNKRYVKDKVLSSAAEKAFKGVLPIGKYGFLALNIEMDPSLVDVNVHPAKLEVRFQDESTIFKTIYNAINNALVKSNLIDKNEKLDERDINYNNSMNFNAELKKLTDNKAEQVNMYDNKPIMTIEDVVAEKIQKEKAQEVKKDEMIKEVPKEEVNSKIDNENIIQSLYLSKKKIENEIGNAKKEITISDTATIVIPPVKSPIEEKTIKLDIPSKEILNKDNLEQLNENTAPKVEKKAESIENSMDSKDLNNASDLNVGEMVTKLIENNIEEKSKTKFSFDEMYSKIFGKAKQDKNNEQENDVASAQYLINDNISLYDEINKKQYFKLIGVAFDKFIIIEIEKALYILDKKNVHERIIFEKIKENYYSNETRDSQLLLLPDIIELSNKEMAIARENKDKFEKAGFQLEEFGQNTIKLIGAPTSCIDLNTKDLFLEILNEINSVARTETREIEERFLATIASNAAIRMDYELSTEEANSLIEQLLKLDDPFTYIANKSIAIKISKTDLEKKFARRK